MLLWGVRSWETGRGIGVWAGGVWFLRCLEMFLGFVLGLVYGLSVVRRACNGTKHRGGLMSGVCGLDDDTVVIQPEEILPLTLDSFFIRIGVLYIC